MKRLIYVAALLLVSSLQACHCDEAPKTGPIAPAEQPAR